MLITGGRKQWQNKEDVEVTKTMTLKIKNICRFLIIINHFQLLIVIFVAKHTFVKKKHFIIVTAKSIRFFLQEFCKQILQ